MPSRPPASLRPRRIVVATLVAACAAPAAAAAVPRLPNPPAPVPGNPADRLTAPIEASVYDPARRCTRRARPGTLALQAWLERNARGASWGSYRCERWGPGSASLHAEGRALDWHLEARDPADAREARRLITLLLAPDRAGNEHALARRMGIQEIIWDCGYWAAGMTAFTRYRACFGRDGRRRRRVSPTIAHRDHVHFGLTRAAAAGRTSFWRR